MLKSPLLKDKQESPLIMSKSSHVSERPLFTYKEIFGDIDWSDVRPSKIVKRDSIMIANRDIDNESKHGLLTPKASSSLDIGSPSVENESTAAEHDLKSDSKNDSDNKDNNNNNNNNNDDNDNNNSGKILSPNNENENDILYSSNDNNNNTNKDDNDNDNDNGSIISGLMNESGKNDKNKIKEAAIGAMRQAMAETMSKKQLSAIDTDSSGKVFSPSAKELDRQKSKKDKSKKKGKKKKKKRTVFVSIKVKRLASVDNVDQTFRLKFHVIFNWLPTKEEYDELIEYKESGGDIEEWKPSWYPQLEFVNLVEEHSEPKWEVYPKLGVYRLTQLKGFGVFDKSHQELEGEINPTTTTTNSNNSNNNTNSNSNIPKTPKKNQKTAKTDNNNNNNSQDTKPLMVDNNSLTEYGSQQQPNIIRMPSDDANNNNNNNKVLSEKEKQDMVKLEEESNQLIADFQHREAYFIRAKLDCDMTFAEEFELLNFPLDCQDLTCIIQERTTKDFKIQFLPELRDPNFCSVDPTYSVFNDWDLCNAFLTLGKSESGRTGSQYPQIEISLKLRRRWEVFFWRIIFFIFCLTAMDLAAYTMTCEEDLGDRLAYIVTLVLTFVAFSDTLFGLIPNVPYLTFLEWYVLACYLFTTIILIQTAVVSWTDVCDNEHNNEWWFRALGGVFVLGHILFFVIAIYKRAYELDKLSMTREEIENEIESRRQQLYIKYNYHSIRNQLNVLKHQPKRTKEFSFAATDKNALDQLKVCCCICKIDSVMNCCLFRLLQCRKRSSMHTLDSMTYDHVREDGINDTSKEGMANIAGNQNNNNNNNNGGGSDVTALTAGTGHTTMNQK